MAMEKQVYVAPECEMINFSLEISFMTESEPGGGQEQPGDGSYA